MQREMWTQICHWNSPQSDQPAAVFLSMDRSKYLNNINKCISFITLQWEVNSYMMTASPL